MKKKKIEVKENTVYVFHNTVFNFNMFINAENAVEAYNKFDLCEMTNRGQWKIFIELEQQPMDGPDEKTNYNK